MILNAAKNRNTGFRPFGSILRFSATLGADVVGVLPGSLRLPFGFVER